MTKLPAVKPRRVMQFLGQNGFILDHTSGQPLHFLQSCFPPPRRGASAQSRLAEGNSDVVAARGGIHAGRVDRLSGREVTPGSPASAALQVGEWRESPFDPAFLPNTAANWAWSGLLW